MSSMRRSILRFGACFLVTAMAVGYGSIASAAAPKKGGAYSGPVARNTAILVTFKVSASGKKVSGLTTSDIPIFCNGGGRPVSIQFKSAKITSKGTFKSSGRQIISSGPYKGQVGFTLKITGTFSTGGKEHGTLTSTSAKSPSCGGETTYTATTT